MMREQHIGDPAFVKVDIERILKEFAEQYAGKIRMDRLLDLPVVTPPMNPSTVYITVVDRDRNVCSFINSIAHAFGAAIVSNKTGILLQNRGGGFRIQPGHPNCIAPGKRPLHTIIPSLVTKDGRAVMPFGVMGGQYQPVGQVHVLTKMLDYGCDVQEAIDMPRGLHYEGIYQLEDGVPPAIVEGLKKLGHKTVSIVATIGSGASPKPGQICVMHYTGWLYEDGKKGKKFDSSLDRNEPFEFPIGQRKVIAGWDEGVATMKVGGKRTLIIPAALGYGARGAGGVIPPNATLMFDVELLDVKG